MKSVNEIVLIPDLALVGEDLAEFEYPEIRIADEVIVSITRQGEQALPTSERVFRFEGCTVIPGLWNLHVHIQRRHLADPGVGTTFRAGAASVENLPPALKAIMAARNAEAALKRGVVAIRDCSSGDYISLHLKRAVEMGILPGPHVFACGMGIASTGGHETHLYNGAIEADGADEIAKAVRQQIKAGADFIKLMASGGIGGFPDREHPDHVELTAEELSVAISQAHARGKKVTAHAMGEASIRACIDAGIDCIEHGVAITPELAGEMKRKGVSYVPTASGIATVAKRIRNAGKTEVADYLDEHVVLRQRESIRSAIQAGVQIGVGTDTLGSVHDEIAILHELGMDARRALQAATVNAASICGMQDQQGILKEGYKADLVIVRKNPLDNLKHLEEVAEVFVRGVPVRI